MRFFLQILLLLFTWFTNLANTTPVFAKGVLPSYDVSFPKAENVIEDSIVKIGEQNFARSGITENIHASKSTSKDNYVLVSASRAGELKIVKGAGDDLLSFVNKSLTQKLDEITTIWNTKYPR